MPLEEGVTKGALGETSLYAKRPFFADRTASSVGKESPVTGGSTGGPTSSTIEGQLTLIGSIGFSLIGIEFAILALSAIPRKCFEKPAKSSARLPSREGAVPERHLSGPREAGQKTSSHSSQK